MSCDPVPGDFSVLEETIEISSFFSRAMFDCVEASGERFLCWIQCCCWWCMGACRSQWKGVEGPLCVLYTVDQIVVCWLGAVELQVNEGRSGECAVSCVFRQSCNVDHREICPFAWLKLTCQSGRASQFVGGQAAACVSLGLVWCGCWALSCGVVSLPLVGASWLWPVCGGSFVCCVGVRACCCVC